MKRLTKIVPGLALLALLFATPAAAEEIIMVCNDGKDDIFIKLDPRFGGSLTTYDHENLYSGVWPTLVEIMSGEWLKFSIDEYKIFEKSAFVSAHRKHESHIEYAKALFDFEFLIARFSTWATLLNGAPQKKGIKGKDKNFPRIKNFPKCKRYEPSPHVDFKSGVTMICQNYKREETQIYKFVELINGEAKVYKRSQGEWLDLDEPRNKAVKEFKAEWRSAYYKVNTPFISDNADSTATSGKAYTLVENVENVELDFEFNKMRRDSWSVDPSGKHFDHKSERDWECERYKQNKPVK